jgi:rRNA biogenesis protein RRP5
MYHHFMQISKISDDKVTSIGMQYEVDTTHQARVIGIDYFHGTPFLSLRPSSLSDQFVQLADIRPGSVVKAKVFRVEDYGVLVKITDEIVALCPKIHLSDVPLKKPELRFKVGSILNFKVLSVNIDESKIVVSQKKSLITSKYKDITSYEDVSVGDISMGFISTVKHYGCIVQFCNNVRAIVPKKNLAYELVADPELVFQVGQPVKCQIQSVEPSSQKMSGTFKIKEVAHADLSVNQIHDALAVSCADNVVYIRFKDSSADACVPKYHLSDHVELAEEFYAALENLTEKSAVDLGPVMVYDIDNSLGIIGTLKSALISNIDQGKLEKGKIFVGVVQNMIDKLCFIKIGNQTAAVGSNSISEQYVSKVQDQLIVGQTVFASLYEIKQDKIYLTLKESMLERVKLREMQTSFVKSYFQEKERLAYLSKADSNWRSSYNIGDAVKSTVVKVTPYGVQMKLKHKVSGTMPSLPTGVNEGDSVVCKIIDIDPISLSADLLYQNNDNADSSNCENALKSQQIFDASVKLSKKGYSVVVIPKLGNAVAFCINHPINIRSSFYLKPEQSIKVKIAEILPDRVICEPILDQKANLILQNHQITNPVDNNFKTLQDLKHGSFIKGIIKSVKANQINVSLGDNLKGRIYISEIFDSFSQIANHNRPISHKVGDEVRCKIIGFYNSKAYNYLPFTHLNKLSNSVVELTIKPSQLALPEGETRPYPVNIGDLEAGTSHIGFVTKVDVTGVWAQIGLNALGLIEEFESSTDLTVLSNLSEYFKVGKAVHCTVLSADGEKRQLNLSIIGNTAPRTFESYKLNDIVPAKVVKYDSTRGYTVKIGSKIFAKLCRTDVVNDSGCEVPEYAPGTFLNTRVAFIDIGKKNIFVTMKEDIEEPQFTEGQIVTGHVADINHNGCFVVISRTKTALAKIADMSDMFIKDFKTIFEIGQIVKCKVLRYSKFTKCR